jgi:hypothetical protein
MNTAHRSPARRSSAVLFALRFCLYLSVAGLLFLHPGISVSYDRAGLIQWFLIVPLGAILAVLPSPGGKGRNKLFLTLPPLLALSLWAGGLSADALPPLAAGLVSFTLTLLLFRHPRWGKIAAAEPFFLAWVCFRLLVFSRSGEDAAGESRGLTQFILVWTAVVFLFHSVTVYFCLYPPSRGGARGEGAVFALALGGALAAVIFILPPDFVRNAVIANLLPDRIDGMTKPNDNDWGIDGRGGRRRGRPTVPGDGSGREPGLRGLSEYDWPGEGEGGRRGSRGRNGRGEGGGSSQQYTVMVVASKQDPVYMGNSFRGRLDPAEGFLPSPEEPLNRLPSQRFFVTWFDGEPVFDRDRERREVFSLSTLPQNFLPYRPFAIEPTVLSENSGPLRYVHRVLADTHTGDPLELARRRGRELSSLEKSALAPYLELPLEAADRALFEDHLAGALDNWRVRRGELIQSDPYLSHIFSIQTEELNENMEKILGILMSFSEYQYNLSNDDDFSIAAVKNFLFGSKDGDCVEFSNSLALLGRLAGIPSRVVTGYLASEGLQTMAHLRGLAALRSRIPALREFPFEDLYLVTDAHSHSWAQFYLPDYGWLDFEATSFAIPPVGMGDGNMRDVVIPLLDENRVFAPVRSFPWKAVLRAAGFLAALALLGAYLLRYGREAVLYLGTKRGGRAGARSLYLLLLARLAAEGKPIKPASRTALEYSRLFPAAAGEEGPFAPFAALYTELRWREFSGGEEREERFRRLREEYRRILKAEGRRGPLAALIRIFSLRGLAYL